jgi:hypothetical protein
MDQIEDKVGSLFDSYFTPAKPPQPPSASRELEYKARASCHDALDQLMKNEPDHHQELCAEDPVEF